MKRQTTGPDFLHRRKRRCPACGRVQETSNLCPVCYVIGTHDNLPYRHPRKEAAIPIYQERAERQLPLFSGNKDQRGSSAATSPPG
jgi:hypothetical protein